MVWMHSLVVWGYRLTEEPLDLENDIKFPTYPDGSRDLDLTLSWSHIQTWKQMEKLVGTGKMKAIGVCNYSVRYLEGLLLHAAVIPAFNQIEGHPERWCRSAMPEKFISWHTDPSGALGLLW